MNPVPGRKGFEVVTTLKWRLRAGKPAVFKENQRLSYRTKPKGPATVLWILYCPWCGTRMNKDYRL